jgi:hypothetical protein
MERNKKMTKCKKENCNNRIWGGNKTGFCIYHFQEFVFREGSEANPKIQITKEVIDKWIES